MTNEQKPREFLEYPMVIDWLQWSDEFKEELGKPDMPQVTLTLISEMKAKIAKLEKENEELKYELKYAIEIIEKNRNNRMEGISYNE